MGDWRKAFAHAQAKQEAMAWALPAPKKAEDKGPPPLTVAAYRLLGAPNER